MYLPTKLPETSEETEKKLRRKLMAIIITLFAIVSVLIGFAVSKLNNQGKLNLQKIIPWTKNYNNNEGNINSLVNIDNINGQNINTSFLPEASGPGSLVTINLANNVSVTMPDSYALYSGWKEELNLSLKNNSSSNQTVNLKFKGLPYTYINDLTPDYDNFLNQVINLSSVNLSPNETKDVELSIQTTKVWDNYFTLYLNEKEQKVNLQVSIKEKTPLFGNDNTACASTQPFKIYFGPDCGEGNCDGLTTNYDCIRNAKRSGSQTCYPVEHEYWPEAESKAIDSCQENLKFNTQITRDTPPLSWGHNMPEENVFYWEKADWYIDALSNKVKAQQPMVNGLMNGGRWTNNITNPDGSKGFYDLDNTFLTDKYKQYAFEVSKRYGPKLNYYEIANEPAAEFYLCDCDLKNVPSFTYIPSNTPDCNATSGPNQPACIGPGVHNYTEEFNETYGSFLVGTVKIASDEIKKNNHKALVITGAIDDQFTGLTPVTKSMISQGILNNNNVAIGVHQYPHNGLQQLWSSQPVNCTYYQKPDNAFWLPEECEKAPTFSGLQTASKNITMSQIWQEMDKRYDASKLLKDAEELGVLDKIYFFDSELHAGFYNVKPKYDLTEAIAGLRIATMNAHQKFLGTVYVLANVNDFNAKVFNEMTRFLTGVTPYYKWEAKLIDSDYTSVVYKLFTRGDEDILVFWSNDDEVKNVSLNTLKFEIEHYQSREVISFDADRGTVDFIEVGNYQDTFNLKPVKEIKVISVIRTNGGQPFDWLEGISY